MSDAAKTITDLLDEADQTPYGAPERALLDQAIALAEEAGHEELAYAARMRLVTSAKMTGDTDGMLAAFAWCLGKFDSDPVRFPSELTGAADSWDLLWYFKWMASTVTGSLQFSSTQLEAVLADMDRRYTEAGVGRSGAVQSLFSSSVETGRLADAERFRLELEALPRDEYSHCEACARSEFADYQQTIGDDAAAVALFDEIQEQQLSCGEEPEGNEADSLLPLLRLGRGEDAAAAHMRGYRAARGNPDNIAMIARHWVFCAVTGNEARGLALLERHIRDLMVDPMNDRQKFAGSCAAAVLLDAVTRAGQGSTPVRHSDDPALAPLLGDHAGPWTAADLAATFWAAADRLAAAFDARNGNDFHARQVARSRALADERYDVPLESSTYTPVVAAEVATNEPTTAEDWLRRAGERAATGDHDGVMDAVERALAAGGREVAADAYRVAVQALVARHQHEQAANTLADRGKALRELGRDDYADVEDQVGLALYGTATAADLPAFDAAIEDARARAGRDVLADLLATRADVLGTEERVDEALRDAQEAAALLVPVAEPTIAERQLRNHAVLHRTFLLMMAQRFEEATGSIDDLLRDAGIGRQTRQVGLRMKAQALATRGRLDEALQAAEEALFLQVAIGGARLVLNAAGLSAQLLSDLGRDAEAAARMRFALRQAESAGGHRRLRREVPARAVPDLVGSGRRGDRSDRRGLPRRVRVRGAAGRARRDHAGPGRRGPARQPAGRRLRRVPAGARARRRGRAPAAADGPGDAAGADAGAVPRRRGHRGDRRRAGAGSRRRGRPVGAADAQRARAGQGEPGRRVGHRGLRRGDRRGERRGRGVARGRRHRLQGARARRCGAPRRGGPVRLGGGGRVRRERRRERGREQRVPGRSDPARPGSRGRGARLLHLGHRAGRGARPGRAPDRTAGGIPRGTGPERVIHRCRGGRPSRHHLCPH
ncbi:hypothetical protein ACH347_19490 [Saccharopolyspora sp. 5N102]|uniref:hypothetical protein n=1 Tax=Saccharopolyspora sp. 5N102 TaxID=3375155 RepID=UPI003791E122